MSNESYNPDVLSCLANLSNDEVFTPPDVVNKMLDLLPQEIWSNKDITFLDPFTKSGVFLREIAKRLIIGLAEEIPDLQQRLDHIFHYQLFGMAITELTSLLSRRSLYCSKYPNCKFSVSKFETIEGNIRFRKVSHTWKNGRCTFCGAQQDKYDRGRDLESHAYELIHTDHPERIFNMKFDVVIGNPPYQLSDGSGASTDASAPLYHKFILNSISLNPKYLCMIVPSKWMVGGRTELNSFRKQMISDTHLKVMVDYENEKDCFPGVHIDGGVNYFLWQKDYNGPVDYTFICSNGDVVKSRRYLKSDDSEFVIRDTRIFDILKKTNKCKSFATIVSKTRPYGIRKYLFNDPSRYPNSGLSEKPFSNSIKIYGVKGIKGGAKRTVGYIRRSTVTANADHIDMYKIFFTTSYSTGAFIPPDAILGMPGETCTETFLEIGPFNTKEEQQNCFDYINTNFFRFFLFYGKGTMQVSQKVFTHIPLIDFKKKWTDEELLKYFDLNEEQISFMDKVAKENSSTAIEEDSDE